MMTFGSFMKSDTWKCSVARDPSRKNAFSFGTEGKTHADFKALDDFQTGSSLLEKLLGRGKGGTSSQSRLVMKTRIQDLKLFLSQGMSTGEERIQRQVPQGTELPFCSLLGCDLTVLGKTRLKRLRVLRVGSKVVFYSFCLSNL